MRTGRELRDEGIRTSVEHAEDTIDDWKATAYAFLVSYCRDNDEFLAEDVRTASLGLVEEPPSNRAWGAIFVKARKNNLITKIGYKEVSNPKAHRTPATLWKVV